MKWFTIMFFLFCSLKGFFYAKYEFVNNNNKIGGAFVVFISVVGFIMNSYIILK